MTMPNRIIALPLSKLPQNQYEPASARLKCSSLGTDLRIGASVHAHIHNHLDSVLTVSISTLQSNVAL